MRVLFVVSEIYPLIKTGGLADVAGSLPKALRNLGVDIRILLPAYRQVKMACADPSPIAHTEVLSRPATLLEERLPGTDVPLYLLDIPQLYDREGGPYLDEEGRPWPDNDERFGALCWAGVKMAVGKLGLDWQPEVVHTHDWQTGLIPALLSLEAARPKVIFTIHNLAYQGIFPEEALEKLRLPLELFHPDGLEFFGKLSFIKGGIAFSDWITTVSPTYAGEIQTSKFGYGLDGLLKRRAEHLRGILNGIDLDKWDPARDPNIAKNYDASCLEAKKENKAALKRYFQLEEGDQLLLAFVGRLVEQKGIDLILKALSHLLSYPLQFIFLGSGQEDFEHGLLYWNRRFPQRVGVYLGYDEKLAHLIEAGADAFLMPSRFEPCGLNQMFSQRYGTVPVVHRVGGLADTVEDLIPLEEKPTGFRFETPESGGLIEAVKRAWWCYEKRPELWQELQKNGMAKDFSWEKSARQYLKLYQA